MSEVNPRIPLGLHPGYDSTGPRPLVVPLLDA